MGQDFLDIQYVTYGVKSVVDASLSMFSCDDGWRVFVCCCVYVVYTAVQYIWELQYNESQGL